MKRLFKSILKDICEILLNILAFYLGVICFLVVDILEPFALSIPLFIGCIGACVLNVLLGKEMAILAWLYLLLLGTLAFISIIYRCSNIIKDRRENNCLERLKLKLNSNFQELQIRNKCRKKDLTNIAFQNYPYVFKARMKNNTIEFQFETNQGEIIHKGKTTDYMWFEKNVYL